MSDEPLDLNELAQLAETFELTDSRPVEGVMSMSRRSAITMRTIGLFTNLSEREAEKFAYLLKSVPRLIAKAQALDEFIKGMDTLIEKGIQQYNEHHEDS